MTTRSVGSGGDPRDGAERPFHLEFVDPLFAVAIHLGLSEGILSTNCVREWYWPNDLEWFNFRVFVLGLLNVILAWIGYHRSVKLRPVKGLGRFSIDVVLVMLYSVVLVKFEDLGAVLDTLAVVYGLYVLWDLLKILEYRQPSNGKWIVSYSRELITGIFFGMFLGLAMLQRSGAAAKGLLLAGAYVGTIGHRLNKEIPVWSQIGAGLKRILVGEQ